VRFPGNNVAALAGYWCEFTGPELEFEEKHKERCHRVYYEELVSLFHPGCSGSVTV
jgi:hypothetical protein